MQALTQYIPLQAGQAAFIKEQNLINNLLGVVGYEVRDGAVIFTDDLTAQNIYYVDMQLVVLDMSHYTEFDILPLPADMAAEVIADVMKLLLTTPAQDTRVDSKTEEPINKR